MTRTEFRTYKTAMVRATRLVLAEGRSDALDEAAFPAYANPNPLIDFLFWERIRRVTRPHVAVLYRPVPLFKILVGRIVSQETERRETV